MITLQSISTIDIIPLDKLRFSAILFRRKIATLEAKKLSVIIKDLPKYESLLHELEEFFAQFEENLESENFCLQALNDDFWLIQAKIGVLSSM